MEIKYTVVSCSEDPIDVIADVNGRKVPAKIMGLVVEVHSECGNMMHTLRLTPEDLQAAKKEFAIGNEIVGTFTRPVND